jgi:uncharacterized protein
MNIRKLKEFIIGKISSGISKNQTYHGPHHTLDVLRVCNLYIKRLKINSDDAYLLRTAALLHDIGFLDAFAKHETNGIKYAKTELPKWGYSKSDIAKIVGMIAATELPQNPKTLLEEVICDADLDYLGTDKFYQVGGTLYTEFLNYNVVANEREWDLMQIKFLQTHKYHTAYAKKHREPLKNKYLQELIKKVS